jgi:signal transduction histidine kinase
MRTPLTVLKGQLDDEPLALKTKNRLIDQIRKMELKINRLLQFARVAAEPSKLEKLNLVKEVRSACVECDATAVRHDIEIQLDAEANQIFVDAAPTAIMLAVMNVLNNAILHSQSQAPIEVKVFETGKVTIRDHGKGIPNNVKENLFTPNGDLPRDGRSKARGLGLVISSEVMGFSRGSISVSDGDGGGTVFTLQFRLSKKSD